MRYENKMDMNGDNMNLFKKQIILYVLLYGGIICTAIGVAGEPDMPLQAILIIAGVLFFIAAAIVNTDQSVHAARSLSACFPAF